MFAVVSSTAARLTAASKYDHDHSQCHHGVKPTSSSKKRHQQQEQGDHQYQRQQQQHQEDHQK